MVTFGGSFMDRLIYEANARFDEKSQLVAQDHTVSLSTFSDRSYNLHVQMAGTQWLNSDSHFCEMLTFVEKYGAVDDTLRGDVDKRLSALLAGLLKGLLRECLSLPDIGGKKIAIERVHQWFQETNYRLLEAKMRRRTAASAAASSEGPPRSSIAVVAPQNATQATDSPSNLEPRTAWTQAPLAPAPAVPPTAALAGPSVTFLQQRQEQEQRAIIDRKLHVYRKSNLTKSREERSRRCGTAPTTEEDFPSNSSPTKQRPAPKIVYKDRRRNGVGVYLHGTPSGDAKVDRANDAAHRTWVMRRIHELESKMDEREMKDCLHMWNQNYARVEEESNRRLESGSIASQTGRTCHHKHMTSVTEDGERVKRNPNRQQPGVPPVEALPDDGDKVPIPKKYDGMDITLSPYDAYVPSMLDRILHEHRDSNMLHGRRVRTPDPRPRLHRLGLQPAHTPNLRCTAPLNIPLDVVLTDDTVMAPALVPTIEKTLLEQIFPVLDGKSEGPSMLRLQQLHLASRIHECFARTKTKDGKVMRQSMSSIQKAILTPQDAPVEECLAMLPRPEQGYLRDYTGTATTKKKGKK